MRTKVPPILEILLLENTPNASIGNKAPRPGENRKIFGDVQGGLFGSNVSIRPGLRYYRSWIFTEGYVLFSVGNVLPLLEVARPACWKEHKTCNKTMVQAFSYMKILRIIGGQFWLASLTVGLVVGGA